jgi:hypothetical protein
VFSALPGTIGVTGDFIWDSNATGVLVIVYSLTNDSDVHYFSNDAKENIDIRVTGLSGTVYSVSIYALKSGVPFPRAVCLPKIINIDNDKNQGLRV